MDNKKTGMATKWLGVRRLDTAVVRSYRRMKKRKLLAKKILLIIVLICTISVLAKVIAICTANHSDTSHSEKDAAPLAISKDIENVKLNPYTIYLEGDGISQTRGERRDGLIEWISIIEETANKKLADIQHEPINMDNYKIIYDGSTVTIRLNTYDKYICKRRFDEEEKEYIINFLAKVMDLEAGSGTLSNKAEKEAVAYTFLIRVDTLKETFEGVFFDETQYGSCYRWGDIDLPSDESLEAAEEVYQNFQRGYLDVPDWLWCQGMEVWGEIYQISFQYPEIDGQSPQYFTDG